MENSSEWHTQVVGVSIDRNGMFEREKRIKGGSKMNILIRKDSKLNIEV